MSVLKQDEVWTTLKNDDDIWSDFNIWINTMTGIQCIRQWSGGPQPPRPYLVTNLMGSRMVRDWPTDLWGDEDAASGQVLGKPVIEMEWNFSVNAYSEAPMNILRPLYAASNLTQVEEPYFPTVVVHDCSIIRNLSEWNDHDWEPRAQMDINLRGYTIDGHLIDTIETSEGIRFTRL